MMRIILKKDPDKRMKMTELFVHPWMQKYFKNNNIKPKSNSVTEFDHLFFTSYKAIK